MTVDIGRNLDSDTVAAIVSWTLYMDDFFSSKIDKCTEIFSVIAARCLNRSTDIVILGTLIKTLAIRAVTRKPIGFWRWILWIPERRNVWLTILYCTYCRFVMESMENRNATCTVIVIKSLCYKGSSKFWRWILWIPELMKQVVNYCVQNC